MWKNVDVAGSLVRALVVTHALRPFRQATQNGNTIAVHPPVVFETLSWNCPPVVSVKKDLRACGYHQDTIPDIADVPHFIAYKTDFNEISERCHCR